MPNFNKADSGYPAITVGVGTGLSSGALLQTPSVSSKVVGRRSPKLWPKRNANALPSNSPTPPTREWSGVCLGTKEDFIKLHEDFGKEVKELIVEWSKRGQGGAVVQEENLIDFG